MLIENQTELLEIGLSRLRLSEELSLEERAVLLGREDAPQPEHHSGEGCG